MPSHEEHCQNSLRKYGKRFDELHTWMDEPWEILGKKHRMYRHDPKTTPQEARKLFGEYADHACLDHIMLDYPELLNSPSGKLGMETSFCVYWKGNENAKWCRYCEKAKHEGEPCFELWRIVRRLAAQNLIFSNNRRGRAFGHRYRIESPSDERCYLKMLQGKRSKFPLPIEDFLYVTKTGMGGMNETPSKTRQNPFVDLLLEIIASDPDGAEIINRVVAILGKHDLDRNASISEKGESTYTSKPKLSQKPKRGEYAGTCPKCGSSLVWRKAQLTGELYRGCTNYQGGCRYQERSYRRTPRGSEYQESSYTNETHPRAEVLSNGDALRGPNNSHFWGPPLKRKEEKEETALESSSWKKKIKRFFVRAAETYFSVVFYIGYFVLCVVVLGIEWAILSILFSIFCSGLGYGTRRRYNQITMRFRTDKGVETPSEFLFMFFIIFLICTAPFLVLINWFYAMFFIVGIICAYYLTIGLP